MTVVQCRALKLTLFFLLQDVVEVFPLSVIEHVHHFSDDPDLNSVLVFNTLQSEDKFAAMHLFQSDRVPVSNPDN